VVAIFHEGELCTATLVAPDIALTAAHCLAELEGELPRVYYGDIVLEGRYVDAVEVGIHPQFCRGCEVDVYDFGFVRLATPLEAPPVTILADQDGWDETMTEEGALTLVGYGNDRSGEAGVRRVVDTEIAELGESGLEYLAGTPGVGTCIGDSGGPAFVRSSNDASTNVLAGVLSRGGAPCGESSFYGAPYAAMCWLEESTGAPVVPEGCASCDCVDTEPGCGCSVVGAAGEPGAVALFAALLMASCRRRSGGRARARRDAGCRSTCSRTRRTDRS